MRGSRAGDYGIDAPGVVRILTLLGLACAAVAWTGPGRRGFTLPAGALLGGSVLMVWNSRIGKRGVVKRMLDELALRGDERVLDVGCGRGLALIEAAKRLPHGRAVGVDVWQRGAQSGNGRHATLANADREGVADRVKVHDGDARRLPFDDGCFDVVLSSLVVHCLPDARGREDAMREMARMLRPGGRVAILDSRHTGACAATLRSAGLVAVHRTGMRFGIFPPVRVVTGRKGGMP